MNSRLDTNGCVHSLVGAPQNDSVPYSALVRLAQHCVQLIKAYKPDWGEEYPVDIRI
jgi:hypothetical protein